MQCGVANKNLSSWVHNSNCTPSRSQACEVLLAVSHDEYNVLHHREGTWISVIFFTVVKLKVDNVGLHDLVVNQ